MYVDESGDSGINNSPTNYYILSCLVVHESSWMNILNDVVSLKRGFKDQFGLLMKEEIHASEYLQKRIKTRNRISRNNRLDILKQCLDWLSKRSDVSLITVRVDKSKRADPFAYAWDILIQRLDNTLAHSNFPNAVTGNEKGIIISDNTDGGKLTRLLRAKRRYNPVNNMIVYGTGSRDIPLRAINEDPVFRDSANSLILQIVDVIAYFARQVYEPNKYVRQKGAKTFYGRLMSIINKRATKKETPFKIVEV